MADHPSPKRKAVESSGMLQRNYVLPRKILFAIPYISAQDLPCGNCVYITYSVGTESPKLRDMKPGQYIPSFQKTGEGALCFK